MIKKLSINRDVDLDNPQCIVDVIKDVRGYLNALEHEFSTRYTYCCGCRDFTKLSLRYEENLEGRTVLRCGVCHSIHKFLD